MNRLADEKETVQEPIIQYAADIGWQYIEPKEASLLRGGQGGIFFKDTLFDRLEKLNPDFMNKEIAENLLKKISRLKPNIEGNLEAYEYLKGMRSIFVPAEKREKDVTLIDRNNIENNIFQVTKEFSYSNGDRSIRQDIVFLINGIPVLFIETKSAKLRDGISSALDQVGKYHRVCPELLTINQVYALTHILKYYYSTTWNYSVKNLCNWKDEAAGNFESLVKAFFDRERIVKLLTDFILFTRKDDELSKVILKPHQVRAVNKVIDRCRAREKQRGLIWHTQGAGKTYTMIVAAKQIIENPMFDNPTVLMLVDRNELQTQLFGNISAVGIEDVEIVKSKRDLKRKLKEDVRGLSVSMIHKFDEIPANINTRKNFFVLVDEAHRTTGGTLGNYLMGALPNATYIGFTGTPIDKSHYGKGTFITFGLDDPPQGYLDKYDIKESIADGTTVPLHYTLAANKLQVDKEVLDREFFALTETEGMSDIEMLNRVLERAVTLRNMLKERGRIKKIARAVVDHYSDYVEPLGYKAFLVAVDREACALYKEELDRIFPPEHSRVVYSTGHKDDELLEKYHLSEDEEKRIRKDFKNPAKLPKILIVTEKLLTGYDAPVLYCIYLDKPMRDHVLLQTIARVNRPYEDEEGREKPSGFVLDFVGIFENLEKALKFDSSDIAGVVNDIGVLKEQFTKLMRQVRQDYLPIIAGKKGEKGLEAVLEFFMDEEVREEFCEIFKQLSVIYDILSPDPFLRPYIEDYGIIAGMFQVIKENFENRLILDKEFSKKTARLVQKHTRSGPIQTSLEIYEIDEDLIRKIEESKASDTEKVFNLLRTIKVEMKKGETYLIAIGEKAENIAKSFIERQKDTREALEEIKKLISEINKARKERAEKDVPDEIFSIYWTLKMEGVDKAEERANGMLDVLKTNPHFRASEAQERKIKQILYRILLNSEKLKGNVSAAKELVEKIIEVLKIDSGKQV